jgi:hypothetical protein
MAWKEFERKRSWPVRDTIQKFSLRDREIQYTTSVIIAGAPAEIQTQHLPNTN